MSFQPWYEYEADPFNSLYIFSHQVAGKEEIVKNSKIIFIIHQKI